MPELEQLAAMARNAEKRGDFPEELRLWRQALELVPRDSEEFEIINHRVQVLSATVDRGAQASKPDHKWLKKFGPLAPILLLLWKLKAVVLLALSKGKLLLFGLGKFSTFSSMLISMGAYWAIYGWRFALGIVISIYVHEMGHVWALRQFGISASAPMFIPFLGAFVRMNQRPANPVEDARVGLAGPIWGTGFAIAAFIWYAVADQPAVGAIAHFAAWINLFNLLPVWQLDGNRGFAALASMQRWIIVCLFVFAWGVTRDGLLVLLVIAAVLRAFDAHAPVERDRGVLVRFAFLIVALAAVLQVAS